MALKIKDYIISSLLLAHHYLRLIVDDHSYSGPVKKNPMEIQQAVVHHKLRCCLHESGLTFNPDRNVKSFRVYMENGFEVWNLRGKFQFQDGE
jgi:hypothetical protein